MWWRALGQWGQPAAHGVKSFTRSVPGRRQRQQYIHCLIVLVHSQACETVCYSLRVWLVLPFQGGEGGREASRGFCDASTMRSVA